MRKERERRNNGHFVSGGARTPLRPITTDEGFKNIHIYVYIVSPNPAYSQDQFFNSRDSSVVWISMLPVSFLGPLSELALPELNFGLPDLDGEKTSWKKVESV